MNKTEQSLCSARLSFNMHIFCKDRKCLQFLAFQQFFQSFYISTNELIIGRTFNTRNKFIRQNRFLLNLYCAFYISLICVCLNIALLRQTERSP